MSRRTAAFAVPIIVVLFGSPANVAAIDFAAPKSYPVGTSPAAIAVGDFNGDGKVDVAVANTGSGDVSVLLGNGDGTFQPATNFSAGNSPRAIAVGEFNGDGKLDLAVFQPTANGVSGSVAILLGNGDGTFQGPKVMTFSQTATFMAVADFNLDKKSDLAIGGGRGLDIFLGNGDGTFQTAKTVASADCGVFPANCIGALAADFNRDSKPDVALVASTGIQILLGNGDGTFTPGGFTTDDGVIPPVVLADVNHDGKVDLIVNAASRNCAPPPPVCQNPLIEAIQVFLGNGDGTFQAEQPAVILNFAFPRGATRLNDPILGDFNGDGKIDLAYEENPAAGSSHRIFLLGKGDGSFSSPVLDFVPSSFALIAQDLNGDRLADLLGIGFADNIEVRLNASPTSGADLGVLFPSSSRGPVTVGANLWFTAEVVNQGPQDATGVTFTDTLPNGTNFVSATSPPGSCVQSNGIVNCSIGALASGADSDVLIVVIPTAVGTISNTMDVTGNELDLVPGNNSATQTVTVVPSVKLTVIDAGSGFGTVNDNLGINCGTTCSATYAQGTSVSLTATPVTGSIFSGWSGACTGSNNICTITMDTDKSVTANFVLGAGLSVTVTGSGNVTSNSGGINCASAGGACSATYVPGTTVSLTAVPVAPSVFTGWSGACTGTDPNVCNVIVNSNVSVTAAFNPPPDFSLSPTSQSLTVAADSQATDVISISEQGGFSSAIQLSCEVAGPAPLPICSLSPNPIPQGANSPSSTLTFRAGALAASVPAPFLRTEKLFASLLPFGLLVCILAPRFDKSRRRWTLCLMILFVAILPVACGSGSNTPPPRNYVVTVTAKSGALQHLTTVAVTVQ